MRNGMGVDQSWIKYPIYVIGFILLLFVTVWLNTDLNNGYEADCKAAGGTFVENKYHSERSACIGGY